MTCAYRVQNLVFPTHKAAARLAVMRARATTCVGVYPLGAADDSTFDSDDGRLVPTASSQGGSIGMSIEVLLPDDR